MGGLWVSDGGCLQGSDWEASGVWVLSRSIVRGFMTSDYGRLSLMKSMSPRD